MLVLQLEPLYLIYILLCSHFKLAQAAFEPAHPAAVQAPANEDDRKYFHEPGGDDLLHHYDSRYFQHIVPDDERKACLRRMVRSYLVKFQELGLETWIAHGTLLGWWWNGKMLPWDWDIDTQVSSATLAYMAEHYNRTLHRFESADGKRDHQYLLDVNPWQWQRDRGDGANIIDARWIDLQTGLFLDITGLAVLHPESKSGVLECKNNHRYEVGDIYPLRQTTYEGVSAMVPYSYAWILEEEYSRQALTLREFEGHRWNEDLGEWVQTLPKAPMAFE